MQKQNTTPTVEPAPALDSSVVSAFLRGVSAGVQAKNPSHLKRLTSAAWQAAWFALSIAAVTAALSTACLALRWLASVIRG